MERTTLAAMPSIATYIHSRDGSGDAGAERPQALAADAPAGASSPGSSPAASGGGRAVGVEDFAGRNAPSQAREQTPGQQQQQQQGGQQPQPQPQRRRPDQAVASVQLLADPPSWEKGYEGLRNFVENVSLSEPIVDFGARDTLG